MLKLFSSAIFFLDVRTVNNMAHLGGVMNKNGRFIAKIDTMESGARFWIEGPARNDEEQAALTGGAPIPGPSPFKPNGLEINPDPFQPNGLEIKGSCDRSNK